MNFEWFKNKLIMRKILTALSFLAISIAANAQDGDTDLTAFNPANVEKYDVKVQTSNAISDKISAKWEQQAEALESNTRGAFFEGLAAVTKTAAFGVMGQSGSAIASVAFATIAASVKGNKSEWRNIVEKENMYEKKLMMLENIDDFYSNVSDAGALDPSGMSFNGFACLQQRGCDTILYVVCRLDTAEAALSRILFHSKFQLQLDTLIFNPQLCNLPNDNSRSFSERKPFSFDERENISLSIDMTITSSWINQAIQVYNDVHLGDFSIKVPIYKENLDSDSIFRYIAGKPGNAGFCQISGDCFIVPRSYMGVRDSRGIYHDAWGTGQYKVTMTVKETCGISPDFEKNWKADWKSRPKTPLKYNLIQSIKQTWDSNSGTWICTLTEAPANYTKQQITNALGADKKNTKTKGVGF